MLSSPFGGIVSNQSMLGFASSIEPSREGFDTLLATGGMVLGFEKRMEADAIRAQVDITEKKLGDEMMMSLCSEFHEDNFEMVPSSNNEVSRARSIDLSNGNNEEVDMEGDEASEYSFHFHELQDNRSRRKYISIAQM
ncbi:hypothetical protein V6N13_054445 [Hibiscus sabdariffa]|uniref:Uncharacterized protein n=1 Tax=Hibiscus sabdariffa TaxID=183260 RepID=A0ABR2DXS8_9ROSI